MKAPIHKLQIQRYNYVIVFIILLSLLPHTILSQTSSSSFKDEYLTSNFKTFYAVDFEMGYCIGPIVEKRLVKTLQDSASFQYPFDSLSRYVKIRTSENGLLRTFSWDRRSGGTWHNMASYAQYKTDSGMVHCQKLDSGNEGKTGAPTDVVIYDIHTLLIENEPHYLLLGWGTHGSGKHHSLARVYKIEEDTLRQCDTIFEGQPDLAVYANRINKIELQYTPKTQTITYYHYEYDPDSGFFKREGSMEKWFLKNKVFLKQ